jgi:chromosomal replication initiator protein
MKELRGIWEKALEGIRPVISEKEYSLWISVLVLGELKDNIALIQAPNKFVAEWVTERYLKTLEKYLNEASGSINQIRVSFESVKKRPQHQGLEIGYFIRRKVFFLI